MEEEKKIKFSAEGTGLFNFIKQAKSSFESLQREGKNLADMFAAQAKAEGLAGKEAFRFTQDMLKMMKEQLKIQKELTKERLEQNKLAQNRLKGEYDPTGDTAGYWSKVNDLYKKGQELESTLKNLSGHERAIKGAALKGSEPSSSSRGSIFGDIVKADFFRDMAQVIRSVPNAKTGVDLISPFARAAGGGLGFLGGAVGSALTGNPALAGVFGRLGAEAGGFIGDSIVRGRMARDEYGRAVYGFRSLTGQVGGLPDSISEYSVTKSKENTKNPLESISIERRANLNFLKERFSRIGMTDAEAVSMMTRASGIMGTGVNAQDNAMLVSGLQRGYGIDEGVTLGALGTQRAGGGNGMTNVQRALGIAIGEGLDKTKFADAVKSQTAIFEMFSKNSTTQNVEDVNRVIFGLNRLGGEFEIGDPRSIGNIAALQSGLADPNNSFGQAQNYALLRRLHHDADPWHLRKMQEGGLQTPEFLQAVLGDISQGSSSDVFKKFQLKGRFPNLSMAAIDTLWSGFKDGKLPNDQEGLDKFLGLSKVESEASKYTTTLQKEQAEIQNAFKDNFILGIGAIASSFEIEMKKAVGEISRAFVLAFPNTSNLSVEREYDKSGALIMSKDGSKMTSPKGIYSKNPVVSDDAIKSLKKTLGQE